MHTIVVFAGRSQHEAVQCARSSPAHSAAHLTRNKCTSFVAIPNEQHFTAAI